LAEKIARNDASEIENTDIELQSFNAIHQELAMQANLSKKMRSTISALVLLSTIFLLGCPPRATVAQINRDPGKYQGKEITVAGTVSDAFGALGSGVFQIDDGTGRLWVFSQSYGVPGSGAKVSVTGRLQQGFSFGGRSFALILRQTQPRH
jgi:hypothetical protein